MWTLFWDMHSGGGQKLDWANIYIEAPQSEAESVFYARFDRNPNRVTCTCCGPDYSISESENLAQATAFHRNCATAYFDKDGNEIQEPNMGWKKERELGITRRYVERPGRDTQPYQTLEQYLSGEEVKVIYANEIQDDERHRDLPEEGYVWRG